MMLVSFLVFWFRFSYPRFREDQLQQFAWKVLHPVVARQHRRTGCPKGGVLVPKPKVPGMIKGLGVTFGTMVQTMKPKKLGGGAVTVQYPHEKEAPPTRARGVIACARRTAPSACCACDPVRIGASTSKATRKRPRRDVPVASPAP